MIGGVTTSAPPALLEGAPAAGDAGDPTGAAALFGDLVAQLLAPQAADADTTAEEPSPGTPVELAPVVAADDRPAALAGPGAAPLLVAAGVPDAAAAPDTEEVVPTPATVDATPTSTSAAAPPSTAPARDRVRTTPTDDATPLSTASAATSPPAAPARDRRVSAVRPGVATTPIEGSVHPIPTTADDGPRTDAPSSRAEPLAAPETEAPPITTGTAVDVAPPAIVDVATPTEATAPAPGPEPVAPLHEQVAVEVRSLHLHDGDRHSITVDLHPAELGAVTVEVRVQDGRVDVTLRAERPGAAEALGASLPDLADALGGHGFEVGDLDVAPRLPLERWTPPPAPGQHGSLDDQRRTPHRDRQPDPRQPEPDAHLVFDALL